MQFSALPESLHEVVTVRPIVASDVPKWFDYLSLPLVYEHTSWNLQSACELMPYVWGAEASTAGSRLRLAIALRSNDELVGTGGFHTVSPENRSAELAYDLAPSIWGRGIATYVCGLLTGWAHTNAGILRVQATVLETNQRSAKVLERCGFQREGLLRSYRLVRGKPGNFFMYSHLEPYEHGA
jgi:ribosomal-protein-alanine N-acetyltransferase